MLGNHAGGTEHRRQVGPTLGRQRSWHTHDNGVGVGQDGGVGGDLKACGQHVDDRVVGEVIDMRPASAQAGHDPLGYVESHDRQSRTHRFLRQWQAYVPQPDDDNVDRHDDSQ